MKKFIFTLLKFLCLPILVLSLAVYLYAKHDVYKDLYFYSNYSWQYSFQRLGDLSTKKLLRSPEKYDSFIFGSSRVISVYACYLQKKIKNSKFFHYGNWGEPIGGIYEKLKLLESLGYNLKNVFIYIDTDFTFWNDGEIINDHYLLTKENRYKYFFDHFTSFWSSDTKFDILLNRKLGYKDYPNWTSDPVTNDSRHVCTESELMEYGIKDTKEGYRHRIDSLKSSGVFKDRSSTQSYKEKQISPNEEEILLKIKQLLVKHNSNYYVVITPLYDQLKFNSADFNILKDIFGKNLYDFSGINKYTNDIYNYPDGSHFQYYISKEIIDSIVVF